jgi:iron complex outermembrane receptor protein
LHVGLDGAFTLASRDFTWGADAIATKVRATELTTAYADDRKLSLAVGPSYFDAGGVAHCGTPDAPIADCVPLNFFGPPGSFTPAMLDYVNANETNRTTNDSRVVDARVTTNDLFALPAGGLGFAAGIQYRRESGSQIIDPLRASGNENGNGVTYESTTGSYSVNEAYLEFDAPLLADKQFAQKLDFVVGTRYSRYTNFGATTNSQFGLRWKPIDDLLVRTNYAEGFRAPAITELFQGTQRGSGVPTTRAIRSTTIRHRHPLCSRVARNSACRPTSIRRTPAATRSRAATGTCNRKRPAPAASVLSTRRSRCLVST